jgi:hypothetical protein
LTRSGYAGFIAQTNINPERVESSGGLGRNEFREFLKRYEVGFDERYVWD